MLHCCLLAMLSVVEIYEESETETDLMLELSDEIWTAFPQLHRNSCFLLPLNYSFAEALIDCDICRLQHHYSEIFSQASQFENYDCQDASIMN